MSLGGVAAFTEASTWYRGFHYEVDRLRGYDHCGDRWCPGVLELDLGPGDSLLTRAGNLHVFSGSYPIRLNVVGVLAASGGTP